MLYQARFPRLFQYLSTYTGLLGVMSCGMHYAWPSPSLPQLGANSSQFTVTNQEGSWIAIMPLCGSVFGCIVAALFVDTIGRKKSILLTAIPFFVHWIMIALSKSPILLLVGRFIAGFGDGAIFTVMPLYIGEISDPQIRGMLGYNISVIWTLGMLLINLIGLSFSIATTALISATVPALLFVTFVWMPESPYFLLMKQNRDQARESLKRFKRGEDVEDELNRLSDAIRQQNRGNLLDLLMRKSNRKGFLIITLLRTAQQFSGVSAITFYTKFIFDQAGDFVSPKRATIAYVTLQVWVTFFSSTIVDRAGRRPLLIMSAVGSGLAMLLEGVYFHLQTATNEARTFNFLPFAALMAFVVMFNLGLQPVPLLMLGELFPTNIKAVASCLAEIYFCLSASAVSKFFQIIKDLHGIYVPFYFFAACCFVNIFLIVAFVPELKGKTLEEIQNELEGDDKSV